jgi:hypothetical protein
MTRKLFELDDDDPLNDPPDAIAFDGHAESDRKPRDQHRHIGCPVRWLQRLLEVVGSPGELAVGLYVYRLRHVRRSRTVIVSNEWLERELGINRFTKYRALRKLAEAGLLHPHPRTRKEATMVTISNKF